MLEFAEISLQILIIAFLTAVGSSVFSFLNVVAYRMPRKKNFISGRDYCPNCNHELKTIDLIPVLSYLCIKGKCRYCGEKISPRYFLMEIFGAAMLLLAYYSFENIAEAITVFAFVCVLTVVTLIDIDTMEIPDVFHLILAAIGLVSIFTIKEISIVSRIIGVFCISVPMLLITLIKTGAFGGGDIKLVAACGILLGARFSVLAAFVAVLTGGAYAALLLATKKKGMKEHFAFGPFLCIGMTVAMFFGNTLIGEYLKLFGI